MQWVKILVILGGVSLLVGFALLAQKVSQKTQQAPRVVEPARETGRVASVTALDGGLAVLVEGEDRQQSLLFYDGQGRLKNRVLFK